jgi:hypothetical protein
MEDIEIIREFLQGAADKGLCTDEAMEALVRVNAKLLEQEEELQIIDGVLAHG